MKIDRARSTRVAIVLSVFLLPALDGCRRHYPPDPAHDVDVIASDGVVLKGSYFSPGRAGPGSCCSTNATWIVMRGTCSLPNW